uniref:Uncharacterized protein n=1 Tax=Anopheles atroparvus TaxID=41427 RepID=A0A182J9I0_ANOAO
MRHLPQLGIEIHGGGGGKDVTTVEHSRGPSAGASWHTASTRSLLTVLVEHVTTAQLPDGALLRWHIETTIVYVTVIYISSFWHRLLLLLLLLWSSASHKLMLLLLRRGTRHGIPIPTDESAKGEKEDQKREISRSGKHQQQQQPLQQQKCNLCYASRHSNGLESVLTATVIVSVLMTGQRLLLLQLISLMTTRPAMMALTAITIHLSPRSNCRIPFDYNRTRFRENLYTVVPFCGRLGNDGSSRNLPPKSPGKWCRRAPHPSTGGGDMLSFWPINPTIPATSNQHFL